MRKVFLGIALSAVLVTALSCGGGGGGERDTSNDVTLSAPPVGAFDGYIVGTATPSMRVNVAPGIMVGDRSDLESRGYVTFNIAALPPPPAVVRAAILEIEQWQVTGTPFPGYGTVWIDHVNLGIAFDPPDFYTVPLDSGFAQVSNSQNPAVHTIDVRAQIGADQIAGRTQASFRLRFNFLSPILPNSQDDTADFNDAEDHAGSGLVPRLTIVYSP